MGQRVSHPGGARAGRSAARPLLHGAVVTGVEGQRIPQELWQLATAAARELGGKPRSPGPSVWTTLDLNAGSTGAIPGSRRPHQPFAAATFVEFPINPVARTPEMRNRVRGVCAGSSPCGYPGTIRRMWVALAEALSRL